MPRPRYGRNNRVQPWMNRGSVKHAAGSIVSMLIGSVSNVPGRLVRRQQHVEHAALDEKHQHGRRAECDAERDAERHQRDRVGGQRGGGSCRDVTKPALQQFAQVGADDDRTEGLAAPRMGMATRT